ncbi:HD-GYP domain-containing protein (c-di-GMP phosphodiesterase class II) [Desulfitispora alkaliphila]|uniref:HD-GYP domain-containing protein n=1 Tax=Desulfitispora alkaliphila TaxID=622674 RepID=UPI003D238A1F
MHKVHISDVKPGMIVGKTIYSFDGKVLLAKGVTIRESYIKKLQHLGLPAIYISDPNSPAEEVSDVISDSTRNEANKNIKDFFCNLQFNDKVDIKKITSSVNNIIDDLLSQKKMVVNLNDIRTYDDYTFGHCVNVGVLSIITGITLGFNHLQLKELGIGAILHDLGKTKIEKNVLNKPGKLTADEFNEIKKHSKFGYDLMRQLENVSALSSHIAFQHHERWDGTGYPRGLKKEEVHLYARIVAVADVYDALVADRIYRKGFLPHEAIEIVIGGTYTQFDPNITEAFFKNISAFPIGSLVKLNTNQVGVVVNVPKGLPTRPDVRLISDKDGAHLRECKPLILSEHPTIFITEVLTPKSSSQVNLNVNSGR